MDPLFLLSGAGMMVVGLGGLGVFRKRWEALGQNAAKGRQNVWHKGPLSE